VGTYFFAVIERSSEDIKKVVENLEFTTKSKIMSTLTILREEGRLIGLLEGIKKGRKEWEYKKDVIAIRNMTLKD